MRRINFDWRPGAVLTVGLLILTTPQARAATMPLQDALRGVETTDLLEVHPALGAPVRGYPIAAMRDTLFLTSQAADTVRLAVPLDEIILVKRFESNAGEGAKVGAISGLVVAGGFGALMGAYLSTLDGDDDWLPGAVAGFLIVGSVGAAGGGIVGTGIGALSHSWVELWPRSAVGPPTETQRAPPGVTRVGVFGGVAQSLLTDYEVTRLSVRASLRRDAGRLLSIGPEISFDDFTGSQVQNGPNGEYVLGADGILRFALTGVVRSPRPGRSPYLTTGVGWFLSNDAYVGAHIGGGMQWRRTNRNDIAVDLRYNFGLQKVNAGQVASYWTAGLSFGFSL